MVLNRSYGYRTLAGGIAVAAIIALSGCSANVGYEEVDLKTNLVTLDVESETVVYPTTPYALSLDESRVVNYAIDLLVQACVEDAGLQVDVIDRRELGDEGAADNSMGLWSMSRAAKWGYTEVPPSQLMSGLLAMNAGFDDDEVQAAWSSCLEQIDEDKRFDLIAVTGENDLTERGRSEAWDQARDEPEWSTIVDEWTSCIEDAGLAPAQDSTGQIRGVNEMGQEQQIRAAIADVSCKDDTNFVQRLADIRASFEEQFVRSNQAALDEQRKTIDSLLESAQKVIAEHG